jgi:hypothetical protein
MRFARFRTPIASLAVAVAATFVLLIVGHVLHTNSNQRLEIEEWEVLNSSMRTKIARHQLENMIAELKDDKVLAKDEVALALYHLLEREVNRSGVLPARCASGLTMAMTLSPGCLSNQRLEIEELELTSAQLRAILYAAHDSVGGDKKDQAASPDLRYFKQPQTTAEVKDQQ